MSGGAAVKPAAIHAGPVPTERDGLRYSLCCTCGNLRTVSEKAHPRLGVFEYPDPESMATGLASGNDHFWNLTPWHRCTEKLKCVVCGQVTTHAYLRTGEFRNWAEQTWGGVR